MLKMILSQHQCIVLQENCKQEQEEQQQQPQQPQQPQQQQPDQYHGTISSNIAETLEASLSVHESNDG